MILLPSCFVPHAAACRDYSSPATGVYNCAKYEYCQVRYLEFQRIPDVLSKQWTCRRDGSQTTGREKRRVYEDAHACRDLQKRQAAESSVHVLAS